jgi:hypothetical protein
MNTSYLPYAEMARIEAERDALELAVRQIARVRIMDAVSAIHMRAIAHAAMRRIHSDVRSEAHVGQTG